MCTAAILAGGRATRFGGRDKGTLLVGGRSILARQLDEVSQFAREILLVHRHPGPGDPGPEYDDAASGAAGLEVRHVRDRVHDRGPLGGLDAALRAAHADRLVLLACDMPFVTAAFLQYLLRLTAEADAVVPRTEHGYHPLCAAYTQACRPVIERRLATSRLAVSGMLDEVRVRAVDSAEVEQFGDRHRLLANLNTPSEFEELVALYGHERA